MTNPHAYYRNNWNPVWIEITEDLTVEDFLDFVHGGLERSYWMFHGPLGGDWTELAADAQLHDRVEYGDLLFFSYSKNGDPHPPINEFKIGHPDEFDMYDFRDLDRD